MPDSAWIVEAKKNSGFPIFLGTGARRVAGAVEDAVDDAVDKAKDLVDRDTK